MSLRDRIYLSPPHIGDMELAFVMKAFEDNWIAPLGPNVDAFEAEFAETVGARYALAVNTGTAAIHLALLVLGVKPGDAVLVSTLTFAASVNPILYVGAQPVLIDSDESSWNMDATLVAETLHDRMRMGRRPAAVVAVHLYGQTVDLDPIVAACREHDVPLIEDAAEALGASYKGRSPGVFGKLGAFSFNGNKIITTSSGGMLVSDDAELIAHARKLATQARDPAPHYEHSEIGHNYRMSNILAGVGRGQLMHLSARVEARRRNYANYKESLGAIPGITFMPEAPWGRHSRWLTTLTIDPRVFGATRDDLRLALEDANIEARPVWKPMHLQPVFSACDRVNGDVAAALFEHGLCLPSGSSLSEDDLSRITGTIKQVANARR